jgi:hypothetical protein
VGGCASSSAISALGACISAKIRVIGGRVTIFMRRSTLNGTQNAARISTDMVASENIRVIGTDARLVRMLRVVCAVLLQAWSTVRYVNNGEDMTTSIVYAVVRATVVMAVVSRGIRGDFITRIGSVNSDMIGVMMPGMGEVMFSMRANGYAVKATVLVLSVYAVHTVKCTGRTKTGTKARNGSETTVCVHQAIPPLNGKSRRHISAMDMIRGDAVKHMALETLDSTRGVTGSTPRFPCLLRLLYLRS